MKEVGWCCAFAHALIALFFAWIASESGGSYAWAFALVAAPLAFLAAVSFGGALLLGSDHPRWRTLGSVLVTLSAVMLVGAVVLLASVFR